MYDMIYLLTKRNICGHRFEQNLIPESGVFKLHEAAGNRPRFADQ